MSLDPGQRRRPAASVCSTSGLVGPLHHHDRQAEIARRLDLGIGRRAAAVLADEEFDVFRAHQRFFVGEVEGAARQDQAMMRAGRRCRPAARSRARDSDAAARRRRRRVADAPASGTLARRSARAPAPPPPSSATSIQRSPLHAPPWRPGEDRAAAASPPRRLRRHGATFARRTDAWRRRQRRCVRRRDRRASPRRRRSRRCASGSAKARDAACVRPATGSLRYRRRPAIAAASALASAVPPRMRRRKGSLRKG